jgi:hypothetical protein
MDYPRQRRLEILNHTQVFDGNTLAREWIEKVRTNKENSRFQRAFVISVVAFDWNCPQHITQRFTAEELSNAHATRQS